MLPHEEAALAAIRAAFRTSIRYTGAGLNDEALSAVKSDTAALPFQGLEGRAREVSFEIAKAVLPQRPDKEDLIVDLGPVPGQYPEERWSVIDISGRDDVAAWVLAVEQAAPE